MNSVDIVFCVLTYKNHFDILDFINNLEKNDYINFTYKIVVVNNFSDENSLKKIKDIAINNDCDFIESENKGYSNGNNLAIEYATKNYKFKYLIVCNPDVLIEKLDMDILNTCKESIIAPSIISLSKKNQNPMYFNYMPISEKLVYYGFLKKNKSLLYSGIIINKFNRIVNLFLMHLFNKNEKKIYACHGSFIIFSDYAVRKLNPVFDENIFLFSEENDLARNAMQKSIPIIYRNDILVHHKEDGSMNFSNKNLLEVQRESFLYYYRKWNKEGRVVFSKPKYDKEK